MAGAYTHKRLYYACVKTYSRICTNTEEIARNHREIDKEQGPGTGLRFAAQLVDLVEIKHKQEIELNIRFIELAPIINPTSTLMLLT
jgi:hypothetical protein